MKRFFLFILIAIVLVSACSSANESNGLPQTGGQAQESEACQPTEADMLGPFYVPGAPERDKVGEGYVLSGVVKSSVDCTPISGAQVEFWLAGSDGIYDDDFRATLFADENGEYRFESHFPPPYAGRPSHIHIKVSAEGYETLVTQQYPSEGDTGATFDLVLAPE